MEDNMPPKVKVTKEDVLSTAIAIVREHGDRALNARLIARTLSCSTQPIFSNFDSMESLRFAVIEYADKLYNEYSDREQSAKKYPPYKATGMAYIRFAKEEPELFKLLFMRDRSEEKKPIGFSRSISELVESATGLDSLRAELFHLEMWICVHGIATMTATGYLELEEELISKIISDTYQGMRGRFDEKE